MAKLDGFIPIVGTLNGLNFYKLNGQYVVRRAGGGFTSKAMKHGTNMQRPRENGSEFGNASKVNKHFRNAIRPLYAGHTFVSFHSRLMGLFTALKKLDTTHKRGERQVAEGVHTALGKRLLQEFVYTPDCIVGTALPFARHYDADTHTLRLKQVSGKAAGFVAGADVLAITMGVLDYEFTPADGTFYASEPVHLYPDTETQDIVLSPTVPVVATNTQLVFMGVRFYQTVNDTLYLLKGKDAVGFEVVAVG